MSFLDEVQTIYLFHSKDDVLTTIDLWRLTWSANPKIVPRKSAQHPEGKVIDRVLVAETQRRNIDIVASNSLRRANKGEDPIVLYGLLKPYIEGIYEWSPTEGIGKLLDDIVD